MRETSGSRRAAAAALLTAGGLFVAGVALGLAAALRFGNALRRTAASCGLATGHDMAWYAVAASVVGVLVAGTATVAELRSRRRPVVVLLGAVTAGAGLFGAAFNLFVVHEIGTCAALFS